MDDDWLTRGMRGFVTRCVDQANRRGTSTVEAEHVLLAVLADTSDPPTAGTPTAATLTAAGLTYDGLWGALREERLRSLVFAGVQPIDAQSLAVTPRRSRPSWGASVSAARSRESSASRGVQSQEVAVVIGILLAEIGTVPRALAIARIDRPTLITQLRLAPVRPAS